MNKREYCVDISIYDKKYDDYTSYEETEWFVDYESALEYFNEIYLEDNECKELWSYEIKPNGDFDGFELEIVEEKRTSN